MVERVRQKAAMDGEQLAKSGYSFKAKILCLVGLLAKMLTFNFL